MPERADLTVLLAEQICLTSKARRQREAWRTLAIEAIECYVEIARDRQMCKHTEYRRVADHLLGERDELIAPPVHREVAALTDYTPPEPP